MDSAKPPTRLATTGLPAAIASRAATPNPSNKDGMTKISIRRRNSSGLATKPRNVTLSPTPRARARVSNASRRAPLQRGATANGQPVAGCFVGALSRYETAGIDAATNQAKLAPFDASIDQAI